MNLLIASAIAAVQEQSVHAFLVARRAAARNHAPNAGGTNAGMTEEARVSYERNAREQISDLGEEPFAETREAMRNYLLHSRAITTPEERGAELTAMVAGFRILRELCDQYETMAARVARVESNVSVRTLANAAGISERNAIKRYRLIPGEGLTSPISASKP